MFITKTAFNPAQITSIQLVVGSAFNWRHIVRTVKSGWWWNRKTEVLDYWVDDTDFPILDELVDDCQDRDYFIDDKIYPYPYILITYTDGVEKYINFLSHNTADYNEMITEAHQTYQELVKKYNLEEQ